MHHLPLSLTHSKIERDPTSVGLTFQKIETTRKKPRGDPGHAAPRLPQEYNTTGYKNSPSDLLPMKFVPSLQVSSRNTKGKKQHISRGFCNYNHGRALVLHVVFSPAVLQVLQSQVSIDAEPRD
jgi:hypothetical protein